LGNHIFCSYDHNDKAYVHSLVEHMRRNGLEAWTDDRIDYGARWWRTVDQAIRSCAAFVVIMTPAAEASPWVEREVLLAQRVKKPIYPLLLSGEGLSLLIEIQHVDVTGGQMPPPSLIAQLQAHAQVAAQGGFVASRRGSRYHRAGCAAAFRIKPENRVTFRTAADARAQDYRPCLRCQPPR